MNRDKQIDLLKIIAAMAVILLHYYNGNIGGAMLHVKQYSINMYYLKFIETLCCCSVNVFVIISSYYLSKSRKITIGKILDLIIQVVFLKFIMNGFLILLGQSKFTISSFFRNILPNDYFIILYSTMYFISPILNKALENLSRKQYEMALIVLFSVFSVYAFLIECLENIVGEAIISMSPVSANGSSAGYTIVNFILLFFISGYLRKYDVKVSKKKSVAVYLFSAVCVFGLSVIGGGKAWSYNNPFVILEATYLFLLFKDVRIEWKYVGVLAEASLTSYIVHIYLLRFCMIDWFVNKTIIIVILHQLFVACALYIISFMIHVFYKNSVGKLAKLLIEKIDFGNIETIINIHY